MATNRQSANDMVVVELLETSQPIDSIRSKSGTTIQDGSFPGSFPSGTSISEQAGFQATSVLNTEIFTTGKVLMDVKEETSRVLLRLEKVTFGIPSRNPVQIAFRLIIQSGIVVEVRSIKMQLLAQGVRKTPTDPEARFEPTKVVPSPESNSAGSGPRTQGPNVQISSNDGSYKKSFVWDINLGGDDDFVEIPFYILAKHTSDVSLHFSLDIRYDPCDGLDDQDPSPTGKSTAEIIQPYTKHVTLSAKLPVDQRPSFHANGYTSPDISEQSVVGELQTILSRAVDKNENLSVLDLGARMERQSSSASGRRTGGNGETATGEGSGTATGDGSGTATGDGSGTATGDGSGPGTGDGSGTGTPSGSGSG